MTGSTIPTWRPRASIRSRTSRPSAGTRDAIRSALFDTLGYLAANPDVAAGGANPLAHYLMFGIYEGRQAVNDDLWH